MNRQGWLWSVCRRLLRIVRVSDAAPLQHAEVADIDLTPSMPDFPDGVIPGHRLNRPVRVDAPRWGQILPRDQYILVLMPFGADEKDIQDIEITADTTFPLPMSIEVAELEALADGTHAVRFDAYLSRGETRHTSNPLPFTIDRTLPPPIVDDANQGKLHLPDVSGTDIAIWVTDHHAVAGSMIRLTWASATSRWTQEKAPANDNAPITFFMPIDEAESRRGSVTVSYVRLSDDTPSKPLFLEVSSLADLPGEGSLAAPVFPAANRAKQILYADLVDGFDIEIPDYVNRSPDDVLLVIVECFEDADPGYVHDPAIDIPIPKGSFQMGPFQPGDTSPPWRYHVPRERVFFDLKAHPQYHFHARYAVTARAFPSHPVLSRSDFVRISLLGQPTAH